MREAGYYWVKTQWDTWLIAFWDAHHKQWTTCGCDVPDDDDFWAEIGEKLEHVA